MCFPTGGMSSKSEQEWTSAVGLEINFDLLCEIKVQTKLFSEIPTSIKNNKKAEVSNMSTSEVAQQSAH